MKGKIDYMKRLFLFCVVLFVSLGLFATKYHSIPLDSEAYRIIEVGENRGIIPVQSEVKPYNLNTVRKLLNEMKASSSLSENEKNIIEKVLSDFDSYYGEEKEGDLSSDDLDILNYTRLGVEAETTERLGYKKSSGFIFDTRNTIAPYIKGDILGILSYDLNFRVNLDVLDVNAFLPTELLYRTDGFYIGLTSGKDRLEKLPDKNLYLGYEAFPEMSTSIKDDMAIIRIGSIKRDWGPGVNNIALSKSASSIFGVELFLKPASWFTYSVMTGSLGLASLESVNGIEWPSENMSAKTGAYSNNISIHRVEVTFKDITASIWESVVWRKRFELGYLNPLAIYMFTQNSLGDYDNCLAGFDAKYTVSNIGTFYAAFAMDELNSVKHPLTCPRNIMAFQAGAVFVLPFGSFTELRFQATYITAFFGAHYLDSNYLGEYTTAYVNKGQNIGYPVNPDTVEFLISFDTTFGEDYKLSVLIKDQLRSAQYSYKETGTDILTYMSYSAYDKGEYYSRAFLANISSNILDAEITLEKSFKNVTFRAGLQGILELSRSFVPEVRTAEEVKYNPGIINSWGSWTKDLSMIVTLGAKVYF